MSNICELTNVGVLHGHNVSHSNRKTKRVFLPNLHKKRFYSSVLGIKLAFKVTPNAIKSVDKKGGIENYLRTAKENILSAKALKIKKMLMRKKESSAIFTIVTN